ncbi:DUF3800 domain-containing protein [Bradyrhizobium guangxiense]
MSEKMHFLYLDESGCTGANLGDPQQPIFVLGGISVKAQGWRETTDRFRKVVDDFFEGQIPADFELHANQLINGEGVFAPYSQEQRNALAHKFLDVVRERKHAVHFVAIDKARLSRALPGEGHAVVKCNIPYLLCFNYMVSYIERYAKEILGRTVRAMIILDQKDAYHEDIDAITNYRRYHVPKVRRLKWLVEFSYPVDSVRHPMVQLSDLTIFLVRKFLEVENGYRDEWSDDAKNFFASCYSKIIKRVKWGTLIDPGGAEEEGAHALLLAAKCTHRRSWKQHYEVATGLK